MRPVLWFVVAPDGVRTKADYDVGVIKDTIFDVFYETGPAVDKVVSLRVVPRHASFRVLVICLRDQPITLTPCPSYSYKGKPARIFQRKFLSPINLNFVVLSVVAHRIRHLQVAHITAVNVGAKARMRF